MNNEKTISVDKLKYYISNAIRSIEEQKAALKEVNKPELHAKIDELEIRRDSFYHLNSVINFLSQN